MGETQKRHGWKFWATLVLVVILLYVASFGPACWISSRTNVGASAVPIIYRPVTWAMSRDKRIASVFIRYARVWSKDGWAWGIVRSRKHSDPNEGQWKWVNVNGG